MGSAPSTHREGYEEANSNLDYLSVQALPAMGNLVMNFTDSEGTLAYALCSTVRYDMDYKNTAYTFSQPLLYEEACDPYNYTLEEVFATVDLKGYGGY